MARRFNTFKELIDFRKICPICENNTIFEISTTSIISNNTLKENLINRFKGISQTMIEEKVKFIIQPNNITEELLDFKELHCKMDIKNNKFIFNTLEAVYNFFDIKISCGSIDHNTDITGGFCFTYSCKYDSEESVESMKLDYNNELKLNIENIELDYELYTILNVSEENNSGYKIKIINDYNINKTSFDIAEINIDGTQGSFKEKRIDIVADNFFKLNNKDKIYSKLNIYFLLDDK